MVTVTPSPLADLLFGKTRRAVLGLVLTRPDESFHLRQIVRTTGAGLGPVQRELRQLTDADLVLREQRGNQTLYRANPESPIYPELRALIIKTVGLVDIVREALTPLAPRIRCAFIFGSFARGEHHRDSDVDLMVIGDLRFADLAKTLAQPQRRLAREINPTVYPPDELAKKLADRHHFLTRVLEEPKIFVLGDQDDLGRLVKKRLGSSSQNKRQRDRLASGGHRS